MLRFFLTDSRSSKLNSKFETSIPFFITTNSFLLSYNFSPASVLAAKYKSACRIRYGFNKTLRILALYSVLCV